MAIAIRKALLNFCFLGDSFIQNVFPRRDKLRDQIICIVIQSIFVMAFCIPIACLVVLFLQFIPPYPELLSFKGFKDVYLLFVLVFMVHIVLNKSNRDYRFPRIIIEGYAVYFYLTRRIELKIINKLLSFVLLCIILYFIITYSSNILSYYPQLKDNHKLFLSAACSLILMMLFLEGTKDELKRSLRQFTFWFFLFILFLAFSFNQINDYILSQLNDENFLNAIAILIGVIFNFAQVLSTGRTAYSKALEHAIKDGIIQRLYNEALTYSKFLKLVEEYSSTQKQLFNDIKDEIIRIGLKKFFVRMIPILGLMGVGIAILTMIQFFSEEIQNLLENTFTSLFNLWVFLLGGNEKLAMSLLFITVLLYYFYNQLFILIDIFKEKQLITILKQIELLLLIVIAIFIFINSSSNNMVLVNFIIPPLALIIILLALLLYFIELIQKYRS